MDDEVLKLEPWEEFKEYVRRKFGIGKYGKERDISRLMKMETRLIDLELIHATAQGKSMRMKETVLSIKSKLKKEYEEFETTKSTGYYYQSQEKMDEADLFLKNYHKKLDELDLMCDELVESYGKVNYLKELIDEKTAEIKKEEYLRSYRSKKDKLEETLKSIRNDSGSREMRR